jgi:arylformamidase
MSASDVRRLTIRAKSAAADPADAVREALSAVARELAAAGGSPAHLTAMTWATVDPAAIHPARRTVDLAYREVFAGFRPPIAFRHGQATIEIEAQAEIPPAGPAEPVWRGFTRVELAREYSPRSQVPDMSALFQAWTKAGTAFRQRHRALDLRYGPTADETLDLYRPASNPRPPVWVFIHGGYWQAADKIQHAQFAAGMLDAGYAVANLDYGLCPQVPLVQIVEQIRRALRFLASNAADLGIDARSMHVAGHSAGGHLAAMTACDPEGPPVRSALLLSGLFDLAPLALIPMGPILGLTPGNLGALSPITFKPQPGVKAFAAVGERESLEFKRQAEDLAAAWGLEKPFIMPGAHHFSLLDGLNTGDLLGHARRIAAR